MTQACHVVHRNLASRRCDYSKDLSQAAIFAPLFLPPSSPFDSFSPNPPFRPSLARLHRVDASFETHARYLADCPRLSPRIPPVALLDVCREGWFRRSGFEHGILPKEGGDSDFRREFRPIQAHPAEAAFNHSIAAA